VGLIGTCLQLQSSYFVLSTYVIRKVSSVQSVWHGWYTRYEDSRGLGVWKVEWLNEPEIGESITIINQRL
jgi:hypothetical protein